MEPTPDRPGPESSAPARPAHRRWMALLLAAVVFGVAGVLVLTVGRPDGQSAAGEAGSAMLDVAPGGRISLAELPPTHRVLYEAAKADLGTFAEVTCYCGCGDFLGHRNLGECFVRPDGGWERHATGCAVCLTEAQQVLDLKAEGKTPSQVSDAIDARFGAIIPGTDDATSPAPADTPADA